MIHEFIANIWVRFFQIYKDYEGRKYQPFYIIKSSFTIFKDFSPRSKEQKINY